MFHEIHLGRPRCGPLTAACERVDKAEVTRNRRWVTLNAFIDLEAGWHRWVLDCPRVSPRQRNVLASSHDATIPLSACGFRSRPVLGHDRISMPYRALNGKSLQTSTRIVSDVCAVTCRIDHRRTGGSHPLVSSEEEVLYDLSAGCLSGCICKFCIMPLSEYRSLCIPLVVPVGLRRQKYAMELVFRRITPQTCGKAGRNVDRGQPHRTACRQRDYFQVGGEESFEDWPLLLDFGYWQCRCIYSGPCVLSLPHTSGRAVSTLQARRTWCRSCKIIRPFSERNRSFPVCLNCIGKRSRWVGRVVWVMRHATFSSPYLNQYLPTKAHPPQPGSLHDAGLT